MPIFSAFVFNLSLNVRTWISFESNVRLHFTTSHYPDSCLDIFSMTHTFHPSYFLIVSSPNTYHAYPSSFYPTETGSLSLYQTRRYPSQHRQFWCGLWRRSVCPISSGWVRHPLSPIHHSPDVSPSLIWCSPGGWGFLHIQRLKGRIIKQGIGVCNKLCCDVRWQGILCCS